MPQGWTPVAEPQGWKVADEKPAAGGHWDDKQIWHPDVKPGVGRADTATIGFNHEKIAQDSADWASTLPPHYQRAAAALRTFGADTVASLIEMITAPESLAVAGAKPVSAALDATGGMLARGGQAAKNAAGVAVDALDPDLVAIASPRGGAALRKIQQVRDVLKARSAGAPAPPNGAMAPRLVKGAAPSLQDAIQGGLNEARQGPSPITTQLQPHIPEPARGVPQPVAMPPAPTLAGRVAEAPNPAVDAIVATNPQPFQGDTAAALDDIAARQTGGGNGTYRAPQAAPVAAPAFQEVLPRGTPSTAPSPKLYNDLAMAARRAKTTIAPADYEALIPAVQQGMSPEDAIATLLQKRLTQAVPGFMTDEQVAAEIAARVGNRSPRRD